MFITANLSISMDIFPSIIAIPGIVWMTNNTYLRIYQVKKHQGARHTKRHIQVFKNYGYFQQHSNVIDRKLITTNNHKGPYFRIPVGHTSFGLYMRVREGVCVR